MDENNPPREPLHEAPAAESFATPSQIKQSRLDRKRAKIVAEIQRNRRGEYTVPTWVLTTLLLVIIAAFVAVIVFAG